MPSTNGHGPKRAILYARVSTDEQARSGYSLAQQIEALRACAAREGYEVLEEVSDAGQSGASLERPGMDRVRDLVASGGVSAVLAQDRDRFAREPAYLFYLREEFAEHQTTLGALNDRGDGSPEGELTTGILDQIARYERLKIAERSRRGKLRKAREGKIIATKRPHYGFRYNASRDGYEVDEKTITVFLPNHKPRRTQISCDTYGKWPSAGGFNQSLEKESTIHEFRIDGVLRSSPIGNSPKLAKKVVINTAIE